MAGISFNQRPTCMTKPSGSCSGAWVQLVGCEFYYFFTPYEVEMVSKGEVTYNVLARKPLQHGPELPAWGELVAC